MHCRRQLKIIGRKTKSELMSSYITIDGWKSNIRFSSAHMIAKYEKCSRLHGHTYAVHAKVVGEPDEKGIIMDFSLLKDILKETVKDLDHKVLIPEKSKTIKIRAPPVTDDLDSHTGYQLYCQTGLFFQTG